MQSLPLLLIRRTRLGSAKVTEGVVERRLKRREMEDGDGEARGARPRPAPEESTMEKTRKMIHLPSIALFEGQTDRTSLEVDVLREGSHADQ